MFLREILSKLESCVSIKDHNPFGFARAKIHIHIEQGLLVRLNISD